MGDISVEAARDKISRGRVTKCKAGIWVRLLLEVYDFCIHAEGTFGCTGRFTKLQAIIDATDSLL